MTTAAQEATPVWGDERIEAYTDVAPMLGSVVCLSGVIEMRNDYEAQLAAAQERIAALEAATQPEPDWTQAPEWAQWWAMDKDGTKYWFNGEPCTTTGFWQVPKEARRADGDPLEYNWRDSKRRRPAQEEEGR